TTYFLTLITPRPIVATSPSSRSHDEATRTVGGPSAGGVMKVKRNVVVRAGACALFVIAAALVGAPSSQGQAGAPRYEVDLSWPKPFPDRWVVGGLGVG